MSQRYIPPSLRARSNVADPTDDASPGISLDSQRRTLADLALSSQNLYTLREICNHHGTESISHTLHDSADTPHRLAFVVLFHDANPRWQSDGIIFVHSNIDILPGYDAFKLRFGKDEHDIEERTTKPSQVVEQDGEVTREVEMTTSTTNETDPKGSDEQEATAVPQGAENDSPDTVSDPMLSEIPVFTQQSGQRDRRLTFAGYFNLDQVDFLKPQSPEVVRMLRQKWEPTSDNPHQLAADNRKRDSAAWKTSLEQEWAVLKLSKTPEADLVGVKEPDIKLMPDDDHGNKQRSSRKDRAFAKRFGGVND